MARSAFLTLVECLADLPDPRVERTRLHRLMDILVIAICAVLCGAEGWDDMAAFGTARQDWLRERFYLPHGILSADTFRRVFARLARPPCKAAFGRGYITFMNACREVIAMALNMALNRANTSKLVLARMAVTRPSSLRQGWLH